MEIRCLELFKQAESLEKKGLSLYKKDRDKYNSETNCITKNIDLSSSPLNPTYFRLDFSPGFYLKLIYLLTL